MTIKTKRHAGELLALLKKIEKDAEKDQDLKAYRELVQHYDKAINILNRHKHHGEAVESLLDAHRTANERLRYYISLKIVSRLKLLGKNLESVIDS